MGKQGASAPCPETLRGSNENTPESPRVFVLFAAKGTSFPQENCKQRIALRQSTALPCDKYAGRTKCACTLPENAPGEQSASAHCPKMCRGSKVSLHIAKKHAGKAKCARTSPKNAPGKQSAPAPCPKMRRGSKVRLRIGRKCAERAKCVRTLPENVPRVFVLFAAKRQKCEQCEQTKTRKQGSALRHMSFLKFLYAGRDDDEENAIHKWGG